jgi:outer membrane protein assembly factor BamB
MYAMDAATGEILWSYPSGGSVASGPAIVNGTVYWGSGFIPTAYLTVGTPNNRLYAFEIPRAAVTTNNAVANIVNEARNAVKAVIDSVVGVVREIARYLGGLH